MELYAKVGPFLNFVENVEQNAPTGQKSRLEGGAPSGVIAHLRRSTSRQRCWERQHLAGSLPDLNLHAAKVDCTAGNFVFPKLEQNALRAKSRFSDRRSQGAVFDCTAREFRNFVFPKRLKRLIYLRVNSAFFFHFCLVRKRDPTFAVALMGILFILARKSRLKGGACFGFLRQSPNGAGHYAAAGFPEFPFLRYL